MTEAIDDDQRIADFKDSPKWRLLPLPHISYPTSHIPYLTSRILHPSDKTHSYITQLAESGAAAGFTVDTFGQVGDYPLLGLTRPANAPNGDAHQIYLSAGIHGDEPAGPQALLELFKSDALPRAHQYAICPLLNPIGFSQGIRENAQGIDLNRDYRDFKSDEVAAHKTWIERRIQKLTCALLLHEDWESQGFYLYELNFTGGPGHSDQIMEAIRRHLPTETAEIIDGRIAEQGIIRPDSLPDLEEGDPEAIYLQKRYGGLNYTLESPSSQNFEQRVGALKAAVLAIL